MGGGRRGMSPGGTRRRVMPAGPGGAEPAGSPSVLFHVQHLLGIGHARRAALIARGLAAAGFRVRVAYGGFPVAGVDFGAADMIRLPPARAADVHFSAILGEDGRPVDEAWRRRRRDALLGAFEAAPAPDVLLTETFPFGRRMLAFELVPLLERAAAARPRPVVAASVRDILVAKDDPAKEAEMADRARRWYDLVLVHGDPAVVPFEATFPFAGRIAERLRYTGYVAAPRPDARVAAAGAMAGDGTDEVIVSVGGGAVGEGLLRAALSARALCRRPDAARARWRLLAGPDLPSGVLDSLRAAAPPGMVAEPARPDFPALLGRCRLAIAQAGYNTVLDIVGARCRAVLVPFAAGKESEQGLRAGLLAERGLAVVVPERELSPARLARAVDTVLEAPPPAAPAIRLDGAAETARMLRAALAGRRSPAARGV